MPHRGRFTPEKEPRYPLYRRLCGPQGRSGQVRKVSLPPGYDPRTVHPVPSRSTDGVIPAYVLTMLCIIIIPIILYPTLNVELYGHIFPLPFCAV
jgi:hypothetical protein